MRARNAKYGRRGFTLVELLVAISIIALLIALLIPAVGVIRNSAKATATTSQFGALDAAIQTYQGEQALGGALPPSSGDYTGADQWKIADPQSTSAATTPDTPVTGAHLLLQALLGQDLQGTPGFRDLDRNGKWANDTTAEDPASGTRGGLYAVDDDSLLPLQPRYPSAGGGYVSDDMKNKSVRNLVELQNRGVVVNWDQQSGEEKSATLNLFVDSWDRPILYYRANRGASRMLPDGDSPGIFQQEDNGLITGTQNSAIGATARQGIDFGAGLQTDVNAYHRIANARSPDRNAATNAIEEDAAYEGSFARFIKDPSTPQFNDPVNRNSYLLISAGADGLYGSDDDVVNWTKAADR